MLDDVAEFAQALDVRGALAGDDRQDPALAQFLAVGVGGVALVAEQRIGAAAWPAGTPCHGRDAVDQCEGLGDFVDVGSGGDDFERVPRPSQIKWCLPPALRRSTGDGALSAPPFARMWEPSTHALDQSSSLAAFSSASRMRCNWSRTYRMPCRHSRSATDRGLITLRRCGRPGRAGLSSALLSGPWGQAEGLRDRPVRSGVRRGAASRGRRCPS